jgi:hypothetical protein
MTPLSMRGNGAGAEPMTGFFIGMTIGVVIGFLTAASLVASAMINATE